VCLPKHHTITFIINGSDWLPLLLTDSSAPDGGVETSAHYLHKQLSKNLYPKFLLHFQKQEEEQTMVLASIQETQLIEKVNQYFYSSCKKLVRV
jgi:hypothetical protein